LKNLYCLLLCGCLSAAIGCSSGASGPKLAAADGTVTFQGKALAGATVMFVPEKGPIAMGVTDLEGKYTLSSGALPGVAVGKAKVSVTAFPPGQSPGDTSAIDKRPQPPEESAAFMKKAEEMQKAMASGQSPQSLQPKSLIPDKYSKAETSGLSFTVEASGKNHFEIPLQ
jgi:hypothetical protein